MTPSARPDDELADTAPAIGFAGRVLRREPLVVMLVARQRDIGIEVVERLPDRLGSFVTAMGDARAEAGWRQ